MTYDVLQRQEIPLETGMLSVAVEEADLPLQEVCGFAARKNKKRGFLFVSRVIGKYTPVKPAAMRNTYSRLVQKLPNLLEPTLFLGIAETATGFGNGVFDEYCRTHSGQNVIYGQSTRYYTNGEVALEFKEPHSHAVDHIIYYPTEPKQRKLFETATSLVLLDDEMSTGTTLINLLHEYRKINTSLAQINFVCVTNWIDAKRRQEIINELAPLRVKFISLLQGNFNFEQDAEYCCDGIPSAVGSPTNKEVLMPQRIKRLWSQITSPICLEDYFTALQVSSLGKVLILGSGEFSYKPFQLAEALEKRGIDVRFQTTTRSPIMVAHDIQRSVEFIDNYDDDIPNFVYNTQKEDYDQIFVCYETKTLPVSHKLLEILSATPIFM